MGLSEDIKQPKFKSEFEKVLLNLMYTSNWLRQQEYYIFKPHGLTSAQYNVLRILRGQGDNAATINLIITRMLDRMSNASRIVDKLVKKGYVSRVQNGSDRRSVDVKITDEGLNLLKFIEKDVQQLFEKINVFTEEETSMANNFLDRFRGSKPD